MPPPLSLSAIQNLHRAPAFSMDKYFCNVFRRCYLSQVVVNAFVARGEFFQSRLEMLRDALKCRLQKSAFLKIRRRATKIGRVMCRSGTGESRYLRFLLSAVPRKSWLARGFGAAPT
jgi:hypothetical protein